MLKQTVSNDHNIDKCLVIEKELSNTLVKCLASYFRACNSENPLLPSHSNSVQLLMYFSETFHLYALRNPFISQMKDYLILQF